MRRRRPPAGYVRLRLRRHYHVSYTWSHGTQLRTGTLQLWVNGPPTRPVVDRIAGLVRTQFRVPDAKVTVTNFTRLGV